MLVETSIINTLIFFICAGALVGIIYDIFFIFKAITRHNILVVNILDFLCSLVGGFLFIYCIFKYQSGVFALFEVICFSFGIIFEQIVVKNLFTSPIKWVYNKVTSKKLKKYFSEE